jgi:hypothetical protein
MVLARVAVMSPTSEQIDPRRDPALDLHRESPADPEGNATHPSRRGSVPPAEVGRAAARHHRAVGLAMYLGIKLLWTANALFLTLFLGILFAIAVSAGVDRLQRFRIPRGIAAALIVVTFFGVLSGFGAWMAPTLRTQGKELRQKLPLAVDRLEEWVNKRQSGIFGVLLGSSDGPESAASDTTPSTATSIPASAAVAAAAPPVPIAAASRDSVRGGAGASLRERLAGHMPSVTRYLFRCRPWAAPCSSSS